MMKPPVIAAPMVELTPEEVFTPDPYQQADMNSYFRMAGEAVGKEIGEEGISQEDVRDILERMRSDEVEVRKSVLKDLTYNKLITPEARIEAARLYLGKSLEDNQDANEYQNAEILFDKKSEEAIAHRSGVLAEEGPRIDDRNGTRRAATKAASVVRNKAEALAVSTAMAVDDDEAANQALLAVRQKADDRYSFIPRAIGKGGFTDIGNTLLELKPLTFTHENGILFDVLQTSGNPKLRALVDKYAGNAVKYAKNYAYEGSGDINSEIAKFVAALPADEKTQLAQHMMAYMKQGITQNLSGGRTLALQNVYDTLLQDIPRKPNPEEETNKWLKGFVEFVGAENLEYAGNALHSTATVVDGVPLLGALARAGRNSARMLKGVSRIAKVSRPAAAKEVAAIARVGGEAVKNDLPDVLAVAMPKGAKSFDRSNISVDLNDALDDIDVFTGRIEEQLNKVLDRPISPISKTAPKAVNDYIKSKGLHGSTSLTTITRSEDGTSVAINGRFGAGDNKGFKTLADAQKSVENVGLSGFGDVKYSLRDKNSGVIYTEADGKTYQSAVALANSKKGAKHFEWYVDSDYNVPTNKLIYADGVAESIIDGVGVPAHRRILFTAGNINPIKNFYSATKDKIVNGLRMGAGGERATEDLFKTMYNNATARIKTKEWPAVNNAMRATQENKGILTKDQLKQLGVESDESIAGYYGLQRSLEASYTFANRGMSRTAAAEGWVRMSSKKGALIGYGKEVKATPILRDGEAVRFADETGDESVRSLSPAQMAALEEQGYKLYQNQAVEWAYGGKEVAYTAVKASDSSVGIRAVREGDEILPREAGYFPEILNDNYAVYGISKSGRKYVVVTSKTSAVADDFVAKEFPEGAFKDKSEFAEKYVSLRVEPFGGANNQPIQIRSGQYENLGGLVYGKKGDTIKSLDGPVGSNYTDPIDAVYTTFRLLADNYTKGAYIQHLENTLIRDMADMPELLRNPAETLRRGVLSMDDFVATPPAHLVKQYEEAITIMRTIEGVKLMPDPTVVKTAQVAQWMAARSSSYPAAQIFMQRVARSGFSPINFYKKYKYFTNMRMRPIPHMQLNAMQAVINAGWPVSSGKAIMLHGVFQNALFARLDYASGAISKAEMDATIKSLRTFEKITGLSSDELADMADAYVTSGLWSQVRHNSLMKHSALNDAERISGIRNGTKSTLRDWASKATDVADSIGAPAGEHFATQFTYIAQYMALRGKNKRYLKTPEGRAALLGRTQDFLGNMAPEGQLSVQRGWLSGMTQFMAFGAKMQLTLTPGLQPTTMTKTDSLRLLVGAIPMYGWRAADSVATVYKRWLNEYVDDPEHPERREQWDKSPARRLAEDGLFGSALDSMWSAMSYIASTDKDALDMDTIDWDVASRVSTGASLGMTDILFEQAGAFVDAFGEIKEGDIASGGSKVALGLLGVKGENNILSIASRYTKLWRNIAPEHRTYENMNALAEAAGTDTLKSIVPMLSDVERFMILRNYGELVQSGVPTGQTGQGSFEDFYYMVMLGAQTRSDMDAFRAQNSLQSFYSNKDDYKKEVRDTAMSIRRWLYNDVLVEGLPQDLTAAAVDKYQAAMSVRLSGLDPDFADDVQQEVHKALMEDTKKLTREGKLVLRYTGEIKAAELNKKGYERVRDIVKTEVGRDDAAMIDALATYMEQYEYAGGEK